MVNGEWLTTGQVIDTLKEGEVAGNLFRVEQEFITNTENGFYWCNKEGKNICGDVLIVNNVVSSMQWRILPKYVTFEEAKEAYENGEKIKCEYISAINRNETCSKTFKKGLPEMEGSLTWYLITKGKWTIKE